MSPRTARPRRVAALLAVLIVPLAACDVPYRVLDEVCDVVGDLGRDATDLLRCGDSGRWEAVMPIEEATMLFDRMTAAVPTPASPAPVESTGGCPVSRRYAAAAAGSAPRDLKLQALVTTIPSTRRGCGCVVPRRWDRGMDPDAAASIRLAMQDKEQLAIAQHAAFGVPAEAVPVAARTIFFRTTWRSFDEQVCLRRTLGRQAEVPGLSRHEWGIAIDLEDWEPRYRGLDEGFLRGRGWCRTNGEGWHFEYRPALARLGQAGRCRS
ncbi:MAG: hypothetical protein R2698_11710 [Microthrixaceae bacterium]